MCVEGVAVLPKVSIIMPSLNVRPYIEQCMESVLGQTLQDIEVICVDADSTDGTREILEKYAAQDSRVRLLRDTKHSTGFAKNLGIDEAQGEYIGIVEPDDYVNIHMFERLYEVAVRDRLDIARGDYTSFTSVGSRKFFVPKKLSLKTFEYGQVINPSRTLRPFAWEMYTWSGIYRREFLQQHNIRHNESSGASFQDIGFWLQAYAYAERVEIISEPFYFYRMDNPNSSVRSADHMRVAVDEFRWIRSYFHNDETTWKKIRPAFANEMIRLGLLAYAHLSKEYRESFSEQMREMLSEVPMTEQQIRDLFSTYNYKYYLLWRESAEAFRLAWHEERQAVRVKQENIVGRIRDFPLFVICSAGSHGVNVQFMLYEKYNLEPVAFCDNNPDKQGTLCNGRPILSMREAADKYPQAFFLVTNKLYGREIAFQLARLGLSDRQIEVCDVEQILDYFI